jgi:thiol-disulfide isomerase/thioredoxin
MNRTQKYLLVFAVTFGVMLYLRFTYVQGFANADAGSANTFALYYADWCPHCQDIKPIFEDWGAKRGSIQINGKTVFVKMFEESSVKDKLEQLKIQGFPTFMLQKADGTTVEYKGDRSPKAWETWLAQNI